MNKGNSETSAQTKFKVLGVSLKQPCSSMPTPWIPGLY